MEDAEYLALPYVLDLNSTIKDSYASTVSNIGGISFIESIMGLIYPF